MTQLSTAYNTLLKVIPGMEVWTVSICYRDEPELSSVQLFPDYDTAKYYFETLIPEESELLISEYVRVKHWSINEQSPYYIHERQYYVNNDYYEHWTEDAWNSGTSMSYFCQLQKYRVQNTINGF